MNPQAQHRADSAAPFPFTTRLAQMVRRVARRISPDGRPDRRLDAPEWWDRIYRNRGPFAASGHYGAPEDLNAQGFSDRWRTLRDVIEAHTAPGHRLLEVGCGNGRMTRELLAMGFDVTAFDVSDEALRLARSYVGATAPCRWLRSSATTFDSEIRFDAVLCAGVLCAVVDDDEHARAVANLVRHVAPGGRFILEEIMIPLVDVADHPYQPGSRIRLRTQEAYEALLEEAGYRALDVVYHVNPVFHQTWTLMVFARDGVELVD